MNISDRHRAVRCAFQVRPEASAMSLMTELDRKIKDYSATVRAIGAFNALEYRAKAALDRRSFLGRPFVLRTNRARYPLWCRPRSSDICVFKQVFEDLEYSCVDEVVDPELIIDCGANVGYSSAYFLTRFPAARLIAIEPDPGNVEACRKNLAPYGDRVTVLNSGVWSHPVGLIVESSHGDGLEWARRVRECRPGEAPHVIATDLETVLEDSGADTISILKVDIEGSEAVVFSSHHEGWLDRVENIAIELHGEECARIFRDAIGDDSFRISRSGELSFCARAPQTTAVH